ncbi:MAG: hypothetical protein GX893_07830 [Firmicutes bacterium]|nr:hypothetical protein [Bacillota bacterium]
MKRTKFVLLALVAALALMGAGYAAWTQSFTIGGHVQTGELFVLITDEGIIDVSLDGQTISPRDAEDKYSFKYPTSSVELGDTSGENQTLQKITYELDLIPGLKVTSQISFENQGSMRTMPRISDVSGNDNIDVLQFTVNGVEVAASEGESKLQALAEAIAEAVGVLDVDAEPKTVTITQELPIDSEGTENLDLNWSVELVFEQYTGQ